MDARHLALATEFCQIVASPDLITYLGLTSPAVSEGALAALKEKRRYLQAMQSNPKWKSQALFLIKHYGAFEALLHEPDAYLGEVRRQKESDKLPMLEMAIDSVLADGVLTKNEEAFIRRSALDLGVSAERFEELLHERARARGIALPRRPGPSAAIPDNDPESSSDVDEPRASGQGWWDAAFIRLMLSAVPRGRGTMVDLACGPAWSALTLLPERPDLEWIGLDTNPENLDFARRSLRNTPIGSRTRLATGEPTHIPLPDESADIALSVMALQGLARPATVFAEARRILRPGGRFVVVEPDTLGHRFYFAGNREALNRAIYGLRLRAATERAPADIALGPKLPALLEGAGLKPVQVALHAIHGAAIEPSGRFITRLRGLVRSMAQTAGLPDTAPEVVAAERALSEIEAKNLPDGLGAHVLPAFLCVGVKT